MTVATTTQTDIQSGETVDLYIRDATKCFVHDGRSAYRLPGTGPAEYVTVADDCAAVTVTRRIPVDGTPQVGEVWRDRVGTRYFATTTQRYDRTIDVILVSEQYGGNGQRWQAVHTGVQGPIVLEWRPEPANDPKQVAEAMLTPDTTVVGAL